jgi:hypothetical protein
MRRSLSRGVSRPSIRERATSTSFLYRDYRGWSRSCRLIGGYIRLAFLQWMAWRSFVFTLVINQG